MNPFTRKIWFLISFFFFLPVFLMAKSTEESLDLRVEPEYFSPNGDGIQDQTFFSPILQSQADPSKWQLTIRNDKLRKVRKLSGAGLSALIKWDGLDKKGNPVDDGKYNAVVKVRGRGLGLTSTPTSFVVDTSPPLVEMKVSTTILGSGGSANEAISFIPEFMDESPIDRWQLQILDLTGRTVFIHWSTGSIQDIAWDGRDTNTNVLVPQGNYRCVFQGWDQAGNESEPAFLDVYVSVTAREMLEQALQRISIVETDIGLIVQLKHKELFDFKGKKPELTPEGEDLLKEVALLVNAYPFASVRLDGYSRMLRAASKDRHRSSLFAWKVYSYLVKQGNVKPSRLSVKGRGRHASFDRRAVNLSLLRNGVEIRLEGDGEW